MVEINTKILNIVWTLYELFCFKMELKLLNFIDQVKD